MLALRQPPISWGESVFRDESKIVKIELGLVALAVSAAMIRPSEPVFDVEALIA